MSTQHGVVSFSVDPDTLDMAGAQMVAYEEAMGVTHVKAPIRTSKAGALPTSRFVQAINTRKQIGVPTLPLFDRAFRPVGGEGPGIFPNAPLNGSGDKLTSDWIDRFTMRAATFLRQLNALCGTTRAICWNEADLDGIGLQPGTNPDPLGDKANALSPAVFGALCFQAARRWKKVAGIAQVYCGGLSILPQTGVADSNPFVYRYMDAAYASLEAYGFHAPWPWAGWVANMEGWWTPDHLAAELAEVRKVMAKHGDTGEIIIGEWLTTNHDYLDHRDLLAPTYAALEATGLEMYAFQGPGKIPYLGDPAQYGAEGLYQWRNAGGFFIAGPDYALGPPVRQLWKQP